MFAEWIKKVFQQIELHQLQTERPIGLKPFYELSNDELLNHLTQPVQSTLKFNTDFPKNYLENPFKFNASFSKKAISRTAPSFAYPPITSYTAYRPYL